MLNLRWTFKSLHHFILINPVKGAGRAWFSCFVTEEGILAGTPGTALSRIFSSSYTEPKVPAGCHWGCLSSTEPAAKSLKGMVSSPKSEPFFHIPRPSQSHTLSATGLSPYHKESPLLDLKKWPEEKEGEKDKLCLPREVGLTRTQIVRVTQIDWWHHIYWYVSEKATDSNKIA